MGPKQFFPWNIPWNISVLSCLHINGLIAVDGACTGLLTRRMTRRETCFPSGGRALECAPKAWETERDESPIIGGQDSGDVPGPAC